MSSNPLQPHRSATTSRDRPLAAEMTVREGRDLYLAENGFSVELYDEPWTKASFFALSFSVPNPLRHRWAIMLHDLHHEAPPRPRGD